MIEFDVKFIEDKDVNTPLDEQLICSLSTCFPHQPIFQTQRYFKECPQYRWYMESDNQVIAHVAVHDKEIICNDEKVRIGGVAEVFVLPDYRRRGLTKRLLGEAEKWMKARNIDFSVLYGEEKIYKSAGYNTINVIVHYLDFESKEWVTEASEDLMIKELTEKKFPEGKIDLQGPTF